MTRPSRMLTRSLFAAVVAVAFLATQVPAVVSAGPLDKSLTALNAYKKLEPRDKVGIFLLTDAIWCLAYVDALRNNPTTPKIVTYRRKCAKYDGAFVTNPNVGQSKALLELVGGLASVMLHILSHQLTTAPPPVEPPADTPDQNEVGGVNEP